MNRLLIIGAGGFGREILGWAIDASQAQNEWDIGGFLDANPSALDGFNCDFGILGDPSTYKPCSHDRFICALGDPVIKLRLCQRIKDQGGRFISLIHPTVVIGPNCHTGEGCVLCPGVVLTTNAILCDFVTLNLHVTIGHDTVIGKGSTLNSHADVTGGAVLGEGVFLGSHASILPRAKVGDYAVVGAGSVVLRKASPKTTVMGVPAKQIYGFDQ